MPPTGARPIRIGCSGWNYKSWKDEFYEGKPARQWLQHYAQHFDTVEVNTTFYRLPLRSSVERWVAETSPGFLFAIKPVEQLGKLHLGNIKECLLFACGYGRLHYSAIFIDDGIP